MDPTETGGSQDPTVPQHPPGPSQLPGGGPPPGPIPPAPQPAAVPPSPQPPLPAAGAPVPAPAQAGAPQQEPVLLAIGDIAITQNWIITPGGHAPLAGSQWMMQDLTTRTSTIPPVAIVLAIIFFLFCLLGLLFLLMKEERVSGSVQVTVRSGGFYHVTQLPVSAAGQLPQMHGMVQQAQQLAYAASLR